MEKQSSKQVVSQLFGTRGWFPGKKFYHKPRGGMFSGWFMVISFIVLFISITITLWYKKKWLYNCP